MGEPFYRTTFSKHLHNLVVSGFYARELDADDFQFLDYVKRRGVANGSLPSTEAVTLEELEFWMLPYCLAPDIERRVGKTPQLVISKEQRAMQQARTNAWHARRAIRAQERAIAAAELAREQQEWAKAKAERRPLASDAEWEAAAPKQAEFGKTVNRHHVPQWKFDDARADRQRRKCTLLDKHRHNHALKREEKLAFKREAARIKRQERELRTKQAAADAEAARLVEANRQLTLERTRQAELAEQDRLRQQAIIDEARRTVARVTAMEHSWQNPAASFTPDSLKQSLLFLIRGSSHAWDRDALQRAIGCGAAELERALDELARENRIRRVTLP